MNEQQFKEIRDGRGFLAGKIYARIINNSVCDSYYGTVTEYRLRILCFDVESAIPIVEELVSLWADGNRLFKRIYIAPAFNQEGKKAVHLGSQLALSLAETTEEFQSMKREIAVQKAIDPISGMARLFTGKTEDKIVISLAPGTNVSNVGKDDIVANCKLPVLPANLSGILMGCWAQLGNNQRIHPHVNLQLCVEEVEI